MRNIPILIVALFFTMAGYSQPRPVETSSKPGSAKAAEPAPSSFPAKYQGGMFGFNDKEDGMLKFDDINERLVFIGKDQKEKFHIPYRSVMVIYPQSRSVTTTAGNVVRHIPLPGAGLAGLIREKRRYLVMHFDDPDVEAARGLISFKLENKKLLDSVLQSLASKAKLTPRGDAFYRPKQIKDEI